MFLDSYHLSRTLATTETVARGAAIVGEFCCKQHVLQMCEQTITMQYQVDDGEVNHSLHVLGYGTCSMDSSHICVTCEDLLKDDCTQDHDCMFNE